ncbi:MAG: hypothetical protein ACYS5V_12645 [Planctomycetota bacterium]|jgi:hypothetical protein
MTLEFPNSPSLGDTYQTTNVIYTWDGEKWVTGGSQVLYATKDYVDSKAVIGLAAWGRFRATREPPNQLVGSYNIASIEQVDHPNNWNITFINPMPNANYAVTATVNEPEMGVTIGFARIRTMTTTGFRLATHLSDGTGADLAPFGFAVYAQESL